MNSYTQFISLGTSRWGKWYGKSYTGFLNAFRENVPATDQLRFILDQTLILSELFWLYGVRSSEFLVSYSKDIQEYTDIVLPKHNFTGIHASILKDIKNIQSVWYGSEWIDVDIKTIKMFLFDLASDNRDNVIHPVACKPGTVIPYLMHRNRFAQEGFTEWNGDVCLPRPRFGELPFISVDGYSIGCRFVARFEDKFGDPQFKKTFDKIKAFPILLFLAKVALRQDADFESILSQLACMCFHYDQTRIGSKNFGLFYATASILNLAFSVDFLDIVRFNGRFIFRTHVRAYRSRFYEQAEALFAFFNLKHVEQGMKMRSKELFIRFFVEFIRTQDNKHTDLEKIIELVASDARRNGGTIAAEGLAAFKRVTGMDCSMEAIDLISRRNTTASTQEPGADEVVEESEGEPAFEADSYDELFKDGADASLEAEEAEGDQTSEDEEDNAPAEDDEGTSDDPPSEGNQDDDQSGDEGNDNADESTGGDDPGGSDPNNSQVNTQTTGEPENVEASDEEGIEIRFVPEGSETVESVILREELDQFITEVLKNPPKKLSSQAVSALTALQQYCIHLLSVETIVGILGRIVSLPEKFKDIKNTHGENS